MIRECATCKKFLGMKCPECGHLEREIAPFSLQSFFLCQKCGREAKFSAAFEHMRGPVYACPQCGAVPPVLACLRFEFWMQCIHCAAVFMLGTGGITSGLCSECSRFEIDY